MPSALDPEPRLRPRAAPACLFDPSTPCEPTGQAHPGPYGTRSTESPAWLTRVRPIRRHRFFRSLPFRFPHPARFLTRSGHRPHCSGA